VEECIIISANRSSDIIRSHTSCRTGICDDEKLLGYIILLIDGLSFFVIEGTGGTNSGYSLIPKELLTVTFHSSPSPLLYIAMSGALIGLVPQWGTPPNLRGGIRIGGGEGE
jgi:hypothetical protein